MAWRDDVVEGVRRIGGQGSLDHIYTSVRAVRAEQELNLPPTWRAIIRRELEYNSSDSRSYQGRFNIFYSLEGGTRPLGATGRGSCGSSRE